MAYGNLNKTTEEINNLLDRVQNGVGVVVEHGTGDTTFELTPNDIHVWGEVAELNLTLAAPSANKEFNFQFTSGAQPTKLSLPSDIRWIANATIEKNKTYQISILNNIAVAGGA